ncbi:Beta-hexosaminidase 1 [Hibiscus syriacus]|uniref:Beta-hexosaminidase n=1 Tax=Hibiscus syriacus TaxID=106335 RepID=A0A6A2YZL4_HIBSY|nr:Beta-hexosaminidase 1 [Hibiscus syriacus]
MGKMVVSKALFYAVAVVAVVLGNSLAVSSASENSKVNIWPMPASVSYGGARLYLASDFAFSSDCESQILKDAFDRMFAVIKQDHVIDANFSVFNRSSLLQGLHIVVSSPNEQLQYGTDESYKLMVPSPEKPGYAQLEDSSGSVVFSRAEYITFLELGCRGVIFRTVSLVLEKCFEIVAAFFEVVLLIHRIMSVAVFLVYAYVLEQNVVGIKAPIELSQGHVSFLYVGGDVSHTAKTVYGTLHGLQTFSQLCYFSISRRVLEVHMSPWTIIDQPRFPYRGLLIDTSRHYLPMAVIKKVIDSMSYAKLNVLHWHIVDTQSFPLEIPSYSKLWDGAYSPSERYSAADAAEVVRHVVLVFFFHIYAQERGINVMAEIDVPGHALSWGVGYPSLWPSKDCKQPLDVSNEFTFKVIDGILSDFSKIFNFKFVHLGGDEVNTTCWTITPRISKWLKRHRMNESQAYQYFVLRAQNIALSHGYEIVNWLGGGVAQRVVASGLKCIVSNQDRWYLDHLDTPWQEFYINEPLTNITNSKQQKLVIGGEVCMWGETVDGSDIEQTIWPRAAAAAERLWTPYDKLAKNPRKVTGRLAHFRCLLNQRGVAAAPLAGSGRAAPLEPGSCYKQ